MMRRSYVLAPFLMMFAVILISIETMAVNEFRRQQELVNASRIDFFSLLEIETIHRIKHQFKTFEPEDFVFTVGEWSIEVIFLDESAMIVYSGPEWIEARLDYDMVFENVLDYQINNSSQSDID
jgi:hypothetical protein